MGAHHIHFDKKDLEERFVFPSGAKKTILTVLGLGIVLTILGIVSLMMGGGHESGHAAINAVGNELASAGGGAAGGEHSTFNWVTRLKANLWISSEFTLGISVIGMFFLAIQYISSSGWSALILRVPTAMATFIPIAGVVLIANFLVSNHDLFHWTHEYLYDVNSPQYDPIIAGKAGFLNFPFYMGRMVVFIAGWTLFYMLLRKNMLAEDTNGGLKHFQNARKISAAFLVFFGVSSSMAAWDWVMSIDTHWFSTMFGWYHFASWWVTGLSVITLTVIFLKQGGYLKLVNENHLHDLGKLVFAFSIFWTYVWFCQFLLIYYANIPEETVYFLERLNHPLYSKLFISLALINFVFPFLGLMTRDAKRKTMILKLVCFVVIAGHWLDFYVMVTPGALKEHGSIGFLEIGLPLVFLSTFAYWIGMQLEKAPLIQKNHPMIEESVYHNC